MPIQEQIAFLMRHSQPVSMEGFNAARYDVTVYHYYAGTGSSPEGEVYIDLQGSNDLENWEDLVVDGIVITSSNAEGYYTSSSLRTDVSFAYVRLQYRVYQIFTNWVSDPSRCVLSAGIELVEE